MLARGSFSRQADLVHGILTYVSVRLKPCDALLYRVIHFSGLDLYQSMKKIHTLRRAALPVLLFALALLSAGCASTSKTESTSGTPDTTFTGRVAPQPGAVPTTVPVAGGRRAAASPLDTVQAGLYDNGKMWTFDNPPVEYLRETYNFTPDAAWFEHARLGALRIPGCTASFVSPNGLVMTNHHCGRGHLPKVTRPGEDLLENGFYAPSLSDERPVASMYADQLINITDVTDEVYAALEGAETDAERAQAREGAIGRVTERLTAEAGGEETGIVVQVISLYHGGRYSAYTFRRYKDVRLVMAPEMQMAHFGGDYDNFTYPRYCLDMTFFRVYDGESPLQTEHYFPWSENGSAEGDLVFVIGNPGSTNRLETVAQLEYRRDVQERYLLDIINSRLDAMRAYYANHPSGALLTQILSLSNSQKAYTGRVAALNDPVLMARRRSTERQFREAIEASPELRTQYGEILDQMTGLQDQRREYAADYGAFLGMQPGSILSAAVLQRALVAYNYLNQQQAGAGESALAPLREQLLSVQDKPRELEVAFLTGRFKLFQNLFGEDSDLVKGVLNGRTPEAAAEYVAAQSALADSAGAAQALAAGTLSMEDPALQVAAAVMPRFTAYQSAFAGLGAQQQELAGSLGRARFDIYGTNVPPDATFSLRIADGVVKGFPYNGTVAPPHTTIYGLYDHYYSYGPDSEWRLPASWVAPPDSLDLSTPMNLVSTNDIIGGNSGSPLLNQDLEVVGLVFDGNIESLEGAYIFRTERNRTVAVDSRAIMESLDEVYDADRMVLELRTGQLVETEQEADTAMNGRR